MNKKEKIKFISFGLGGFGAEIECGKDSLSSSSSLSGYDKPEGFEKWLALNTEKYDCEGAVVIDKREVLTERPGLAISEPMVDIKLKDGEVEKCPEPSEMLANGVCNQFKTILKMNAAQNAVKTQYSCLDQISISAYVELWRGYGGRIGKITGNRIQWEV